MRDIYAVAAISEDEAIQEKANLKARGFQVTVFGKSDYLTIDTRAISGGCMSRGEQGWLVVGIKS